MSRFSSRWQSNPPVTGRPKVRFLQAAPRRGSTQFGQQAQGAPAEGERCPATNFMTHDKHEKLHVRTLELEVGADVWCVREDGQGVAGRVASISWYIWLALFFFGDVPGWMIEHGITIEIPAPAVE